MKYKLILIIFLLSSSLFAQPWMNSLKDKKSNNITFFDYQNAFNNYWKGKKVINGYYTENGTQQKAYGWKQFKRWEYFWSTRVDHKTGEFPSPEQNKKANIQFRESKNQNRSISGQWVNLGPSSTEGGYAGVGRISTIAFHPTDNNTFWIGAPAGGLWQTTDGGNTWTVYTDQNDVLGVSAIAIPSDYESSKTIYIGTGDRDAHDNNSLGVLKSTDGGNSWNSTGLSFNLEYGNQIVRLLIDPNDNNLIYAATNAGVYRSSDGGDNWDKIINNGGISDMEFNTNNPNILYISNYTGVIYRYSINEDNLTTVYNNSDGRRIELAVTNDNANIIYGVVGNILNGLLEIVKSTDGGLSFTAIYNEKNLLGWRSSGGDIEGQAWYDLALAADPNNADIVYCGGINTWKSEDGGNTWEIANHWWGDRVQAVHADKHFLAYHNTKLYECNDGGVYSTTDGETWDNISNGIISSQMYKLSVSQTESKYTITGLQDNGTKLFDTDNGWRDVKSGDGMECLIDYSNSDIQYGSYTYGQISRTTDGWHGDYTNIEPYDAGDGAWVTPYIIHPTNPNVLYAGYADVWKTEDRGDSWTAISDIYFENKIRAMAVSISNPQVLYITDQNNIWKTTNEGDSWNNVSSNLPDGVYTSIAIKNDDPNTVWITMGEYNSNTVFQTTNGGDSWTNISSGIPNIPANTIVQDSSSSSLYLYVGTDFGVYFKKGTNDWQFFNTGLPKVVVDELDIYYDSDRNKSRLRAATYGRGLWESDLYFPQDPPIVDFKADRTLIVEGNTVNFTDLSTEGPSSWEWEFEGGTPSSSSEQNPSITYNTQGLYKVKLTAKNSVGEDEATKIDYIEVQEVGPTPTALFDVSDTVICLNNTLLFTDLSTEDPISWEWKVIPSNGVLFQNSTNKYSQNPEIFFSKAGEYSIQLTATNISGSGDTLKEKYIVVNGTPDFPEYINPKLTVCKNNEDIYNVIQEDTNIYHWYLPSGWSGTSSTNSIAITNNGVNGNLYVAAENKCGIGSKKKLEITVIDEKPSQPSPIDGPNPICENSTVEYSVNKESNTSYYWDLPSGWTGNNEHKNIIEVNTTTQGGTITLVPLNACGVGISRTLHISTNQPIESVSSISGENEVCQASSQVYSISAENATIYDWFLPSDWSGNSTFSSISTTVGNNNGTIQVIPKNACGSSDTVKFSVQVNPLPIANFNYSQDNNRVNFDNQSQYSDSYYWTFGDDNTSTETNPIHEYSTSGNYTITLTAQNECAEKRYYTNVNIAIVNVNNELFSKITLYPNPTTGLISIQGIENSEAQITLVNTLGQILIKEQTIGQTKTIDISMYSEGLYQILILYHDTIYKQSIILQK